MDELTLLRELVVDEPFEDEAARVEVWRRLVQGDTRPRRGYLEDPIRRLTTHMRRRRRLLVVMAAVLVVVVASASAVGKVRSLFFDGPPAMTSSPTWSADGRRIAYLLERTDASSTWTEIFVLKADGSGGGRLIRMAPGDFSPSLSPDWRKIAFLRNRCYAVQGACTENTTIYVMNADGSGKRRLARGGSRHHWDDRGTICLGQPQGGCDGLAWSPDGRRIAFMSDRDGNFEIYVVNADGSEERRLTREPEFDSVPVWSPDGRKMAFVRSIRDRSGIPRLGEIYVMNADGSGQRMVARGQAPAWSPDGRQIAFRSGRDGNGEVYVVNVDGSGLRRLTRNPASDGGPLWSPDGRKIAFVRFRHGKSDIYLMNADGSGQRNLTPDAISGRWARDVSPAWSPDGQKIVYVNQRDGAVGFLDLGDTFVARARAICMAAGTRKDAAFRKLHDWSKPPIESGEAEQNTYARITEDALAKLHALPPPPRADRPHLAKWFSIAERLPHVHREAAAAAAAGDRALFGKLGRKRVQLTHWEGFVGFKFGMPGECPVWAGG